jgi:hypothetical protein
MHRLLSKLPILVICTIAAPADAMCIITVAPPAGSVDADGRPRLYGCPQIVHRTPPTAQTGARGDEMASRPAIAPTVPRRSDRDARIARALGQGYTGFKKVYRGQRYLGFKKVYSGPRYPADLYGSGSRWRF